MQTITTVLAFDNEAEEAVNLYLSLFAPIFGNSELIKATYFGKEEIEELSKLPDITADILPGPVGSVKTLRFRLNGQELMAVNGGSYFGKFTESISLYIGCDTQEQIDKLWEGLSDGGVVQPCGWVQDRFGVSWQIAPNLVWEIAEGSDLGRAQRIMKAIYKMKKIDLEMVQQA